MSKKTIFNQLNNLDDLPFSTYIGIVDDILTIKILDIEIELMFFFPGSYPWEPCTVYVTGDIIHENIKNGQLDLCDWSPLFTIRQILLITYIIFMENDGITIIENNNIIDD